MINMVNNFYKLYLNKNLNIKYIMTDFYSSEVSEMEFVNLGPHRGVNHQKGGEVDEETAMNKKWMNDFQNIYEKAKGYSMGTPSVASQEGGCTAFDAVAKEMFGGAKSVVGAKLFEIASVLRKHWLEKEENPGVNPLGVSKVIWDSVVEEIGDKDVDAVTKKAKELANKPDEYVKKYEKLSHVGNIIIKSTGAKNAIRMKLARLAWEEAIKKTNSEDVNVVEKEAVKLAETHAHRYVKEVKEEQKRALQKRIRHK